MHHSQRICHLLSLSLLTNVPDLWDCIYSNVNPFYLSPQSIQSARLSFPSSELVVLGPFGERHTHLRGEGVGGPNSEEEYFMYSITHLLKRYVVFQVNDAAMIQ